MDCSPPGSSVQWISQARILKWVAISFSRGSSWPRNQTCVSCIVRWILYHWASWEAKFHVPFFFICKPKVLHGQSRFGLTFIELLEGILHEFCTDECCQQAIYSSHSVLSFQDRKQRREWTLEKGVERKQTRTLGMMNVLKWLELGENRYKEN